VPNRGTRHMISTTKNGGLEIRIGNGDWYLISTGAINHADPIEAASSVAQAPSYWESDLS
jgi:hypothetical protein